MTRAYPKGLKQNTMILKSKNPKTPDIHNIEEFQDVVADILGDYFRSFYGDLIEEIDLDEYPEAEPFGWMLSAKGSKLLDRQIARMRQLGLRKFGCEPDIQVEGLVEI